MDIKVSKFIETLIDCFSTFNENSKNELKILLSRDDGFKFDSLSGLLDDLDFVDKFSQETIPGFDQLINSFECFLSGIYEDKVFLELDYIFLETLARTAYKIDNYYLKLKLLRIILIWLYNYPDSKNDAHSSFIINLLNTSCDALENICLRRMALAIVNRLIKKNVKNKQTIMDKNQFFNLKEIGRSILVSDDFKIQELSAELVHELLPPRNSPLEFYNRRFDLFFSLNSLSEDLKAEFFEMQNSGWVYSPKWLTSLNIERNCSSSPLTFECIYLKFGESMFNSPDNNGILYVHLSHNFITSVIVDSKNEKKLLDIALKNIEEIRESDSQIVLRLKEILDNDSIIGDEFNSFDIIEFYFDDKPETGIIIQEIVKRIKRNMNLGAKIKCSMIECPISLRFQESNICHSDDFFSQQRIIDMDIDKNINIVEENSFQENKFENSKFLDANEDTENKKASSIDFDETKEVEHQQSVDFCHLANNNCSSVTNSSLEKSKKTENKPFLRVSTQVKDLFSLVTLENNNKNVSRDIKLPEKMKKKSEGLKELTNILPPLDEISKVDKNANSSIKQKKNANENINMDIYDFPFDGAFRFNRSQINKSRSKKKYMLKSNFPTHAPQKKCKIKNKSQETNKRYSDKDSATNDYSSATDYDIIPDDFLRNKNTKRLKKTDKTIAKNMLHQDKMSNNKESLIKEKLPQSNKYSLKPSKKIPKDVKNDLSELSDSSSLSELSYFSDSSELSGPDDAMMDLILEKNTPDEFKVHSLKCQEDIKDNCESFSIKTLQSEKKKDSTLIENSLYKKNNGVCNDIRKDDKMNIELMDEYSQSEPQIIVWSKDGPLNNICKTENNYKKLDNLSKIKVSGNKFLCDSEIDVSKLSVVNENIKDVNMKYLYPKDFIAIDESKTKIEKDFKNSISNNFSYEIPKNFDDVFIATNDESFPCVNDSAINSLNMCKKNDVFDEYVNPNNFYNILNGYGLLSGIKIDDIKDFSETDLDKAFINLDSTEQFLELSSQGDYDSQLNNSDIECNDDVYNKCFYKSKWKRKLPQHHKKTLSLLMDIVQIIINKLITYELNINDYVQDFKGNINKIIEALNMVRYDKKLNIENYFFFRNGCNKRFVNHLNGVKKHKKVSENIKLNIKKGYLARKNIIDNFYNNISNIY
ncbi:hypothetical protein T552_00342 [Pneumocystis carinii B80]|uniref:Uncharacterized protein n=1 Tax=Pneumocystis carinii (strain B80) TaxID=1408658 RepID=A0A0W4ZQL1_PNEC8|nr:hypothetical protein T552_00342 [Pneumocystis carinii B80]KTW30626.1 hypothetical protein T552_00342 [Pneumocystis carinii B80]